MKADRCVKKIEQKRSFLPSRTTVCALWRQFDPNMGPHDCLLLIHTNDMSKKVCIFESGRAKKFAYSIVYTYKKLMRSQNSMWDIDTKQDREKTDLVPSTVCFSFDITVIDLTGCAWRKRSVTGRSPHGSMPCPTYRKKSPVNLHGTFLLPDQRTIVPFGRSLAIVTSERSASSS